MSFSPIPDFKFQRLTDITKEFLDKCGVRLLMLDLDNTIAPYGVDMPCADMILWADKLKRGGITLYIISNSKKDRRVSAFSGALGIPYVNKARKPSPQKLLEVMQRLGIPPGSSAMAGDQIYTDVLAGNFAEVTAILVYPIKFTNPFLAARYALELPFRALRRIQKTGV